MNYQQEFLNLVEKMFRSITNGIYFNYYFFQALRAMIGDVAVILPDINASGLTQEQKDNLTNHVIPLYQDASSKEFLPAFYGNTLELFKDFLALIEFYAITNPGVIEAQKIVTNLNKLEFILSDEDSYKMPSFLMRNLYIAKNAIADLLQV